MVITTLEYIKDIGIIKEAKELLAEFSGLDLEILNIHSSPVSFPCLSRHLKTKECHKYSHLPCNHIKQGIIEDLHLYKATRMFICSSGMRKIVVPLILNNKLIGILFAGENSSCQLEDNKLSIISRLLYQVANYIIKTESSQLNGFKTNMLTFRQQRLQKVVHYIQDNSRTNDLTLKRVASDNAISYYYLSHLFKKEMNTTFAKYRTKVKMNLAARLLKDFKLTVNQISEACGFDDPSYFCKVFKTVHKRSPGGFRQDVLSRKNKKRYAPAQKFTKAKVPEEGAVSKKLP